MAESEGVTEGTNPSMRGEKDEIGGAGGCALDLSGRLDDSGVGGRIAPPPGSSVPIAILGAGITGLTIARLLLEAGYTSVSVIASTWTPATTSDGAGAFWERRSDGHARWARATLRYYEELIARGEGEAAGVGWVDGCGYSFDATQYQGFAEDVPAFELCSAEDVAAASARCGGAPFASGVAWRSVIVDSPVHMRWLMARVLRLGARLAQAHVASVTALQRHFAVVVNASGLGARELANDAAVHAYRGQVVRAWAPHVQRWATASGAPNSEWHATYVLPRPTSGVVVCGGTYQRDDEDVSCRAEEVAALWARCCALVPELADPRTVLLDEWAGLRPGRDGDVRVELEWAPPLEGQAWPAAVVHAYGHGGCGHSLHIGSAEDARALVAQAAARVQAAVDAAGGQGHHPRDLPRFEAPAPILRTSVHVMLPALARAAGPDAVAEVLRGEGGVKGVL